jgi:hypothetical protein
MGALERLIGFLPIMLLFLVPALLGLRRLSRRRRRNEAPETGPDTAAGQPPVSQTPAGPRARDRTAVLVEGKQAASGRAAGAAGRTVVVPAAMMASPQRELYVYPPQLRFDRLPVSETPGRERGAMTPPSAASREAERSYRLSRAALLSSVSPGKPGRSSGEAIWRRLHTLPPLQRAIAFAEILGPPRGLGSHEYAERFDSTP